MSDQTTGPGNVPGPPTRWAFRDERNQWGTQVPDLGEGPGLRTLRNDVASDARDARDAVLQLIDVAQVMLAELESCDRGNLAKRSGLHEVYTLAVDAQRQYDRLRTKLDTLWLASQIGL